MSWFLSYSSLHICIFDWLKAQDVTLTSKILSKEIGKEAFTRAVAPVLYKGRRNGVVEEPDYDGSNTAKRSWLELHRPVGWKTEWLKSEDMSDAASPGDKLRRAVRLRFFNNQEVLAERVSSITEVKYLSYNISVLESPLPKARG